MSEMFVFGASGFIGRHMVKEFGFDVISPVTRNIRQGTDKGCWFEADILSPQSLGKILTPGSVVVNLAYSANVPAVENIKMAKNLVQACLRAKVSRLVHCSTAVVAGANVSPVIDENSECFPSTVYERNKHDIEKIFTGAVSCDLSVYILRPTAVVGPGGQNLNKLLSEILEGNNLVNFIRSSVHGKRKLNLVPVKDVVRALFHLGTHPSIPSGVYICSADDDPCNRYDSVEGIIREVLGKPSRMTSVRLLSYILSFLLRVTRSGSGQFGNRCYSSEKLSTTGFQRTEKISNAVRDFVLSEVRERVVGGL